MEWLVLSNRSTYYTVFCTLFLYSVGLNGAVCIELLNCWASMYCVLLDCILISSSRLFIVCWSMSLCVSIFVCSSVMLHFSKLMIMALAMFWHSFVLIETSVANSHCSLHTKQNKRPTKQCYTIPRWSIMWAIDIIGLVFFWGGFSSINSCFRHTFWRKRSWQHREYTVVHTHIRERLHHPHESN